MLEVPQPPADKVSRRRYDRALAAREEAEHLLEIKSRELFEANQRLLQSKSSLELAVKERTAELDAARIAAEAANDAKTIFLASMSHEIRTPLNGILGMALALSESGLNEEQDSILNVIRDSGGLLLSVINDILDLSKIEAGKLECESIPCGIKDLIVSVQRQYLLKAQEKGLVFEVTLADPADIWARTDATRLRQVIGNLLSNAIKFTNQGYVALNVELNTVSETQAQLVMTVQDTGPGIPKEHQSRLFKPFSQADNSISRSFGGTGLGLAISQRICQTMGGDLSLVSEAGKGATFEATVTVEPCEDDRGAEDQEEWSEAVLKAKPWRILAAEDNRTNQLVLKHMLKRFGVQLEITNNGEELVSRWQSDEWDLILMDVNMPVMDGLQATQFIRDKEHEMAAEPIPIIAVSANAMFHQISGYLSNGMTGHVAKPVRRPELARAMAQALSPEAGMRAM